MITIYTAGEMDENDDARGNNTPKPHMLLSSSNWRYRLEGYLNEFELGREINWNHPKLDGCDHHGLDGYDTICNDTKKIFESDAVIAYLNRTELYATTVELMYANQMNKAILVLIKPGLTSETFTGGHKCNCMFCQDEDTMKFQNPYWFLLYNLKNRCKRFKINIFDLNDIFDRKPQLNIIIKSFLVSASLLKSDYTKYITSDEWKEKSIKFKSNNNGVCSLCNTWVGIENLETHHKKYPKDFKNDDEVNWITICKTCHRKLHGIQ